MKKRRISKKRVAYAILVTLNFLFLLWILLSVIDTNLHNHPDSQYGQYSFWNFFNILF